MNTLLCAVRSTLYYLVIVIMTATCCISLLAFVFTSPQYRSRYLKIWATAGTLIGRYICGIRYKVIYEAPCPDEPCLYVANHQSAWETIAIYSLLPPHVHIIKKELRYLPVFGWGAGSILIDRAQGVSAFRHMRTEAKKRLAHGLSMIIFPEGTRSPPGTLGTFFKGGTALAKGLKLPIVPITHNAGHCWPRNSFLKKPGLVTIVIGKAIDSSEFSTDELHGIAYETIKRTMGTIDTQRKDTDGHQDI